jgi:hypothetical protein
MYTYTNGANDSQKILFRTAGLPLVTFKDYGILLLECDLVNSVRVTHLSMLEASCSIEASYASASVTI